MSALVLLVLTSTVGSLAVVSILMLRNADQQRRDAARRCYLVSFPRTVTADQVQAFIVLLAGLSAGRRSWWGQDSAVLEVIMTREGVTHRLRLPRRSSVHFLAQLRAAIPGISLIEVAENPARVMAAKELRQRNPQWPLAVIDAAAVARTILASSAQLKKGELLVWQCVIVGGIPRQAPVTTSWVRAFIRAVTVGTEPETPERGARRRRQESGLTAGVVRIGATGRTAARTKQLITRLLAVAKTVATPEAQLIPRAITASRAARRLQAGASPLMEPSILASPSEFGGLVGWPIGPLAIPGLTLGGSPQLIVPQAVPTSGRVLGDATVGKRTVAVSVQGSFEHLVTVAPTGAGKSVLAAQLALGDIVARRGVCVIDPKGTLIRLIIERMPEWAIKRVVLVDPTDISMPVPIPLFSPDRGASSELAVDGVLALLQHRYRDLGPRSTDILLSSLRAIAPMPKSTILMLWKLWNDTAFRARVRATTVSDPILDGFFTWFEQLSESGRAEVLAAPTNKLRPLVSRSIVRNVIAAPRATFTMREALAKRLIVLVSLPEGALGAEATSFLGQVVLSRLWAAIQARGGLAEDRRPPFMVTVDEAPRFVDLPTDLGEMLARAREYRVSLSLIGQSLKQFPDHLKDMMLNSARTKISFQGSAKDARELAAEFGPLVTPEMIQGLGRFEAIGAVSLGGATSEPFTFRTRPLDEAVPGRADQVRAASRKSWGVPRAEIEEHYFSQLSPPDDASGPIGRRVER
jgi:hypothetical protein